MLFFPPPTASFQEMAAPKKCREIARKTNKNSVCPVVSTAKTYTHRATTAVCVFVCVCVCDERLEGVTD